MADAEGAQLADEDGEDESIDKTELNNLLFGANPNANDMKRWHEQGFVFSTDANRATCFGLAQQNGGPCGVLVPIQAYFLIRLIFSDNLDGITKTEDVDNPFTATEERRRIEFIETLADVLLRVGAGGEVILAIANDETSVQCVSCSSRDDLVNNLDTFYEVVYSSPLGVLLFVYSLILTRKIDRLKSDMDDFTQPLVQRFGHCSQELVNLVICGQAVSNVFDGDKDVGGLKVKGIPQTYDIGYLTLLEALRYSKVGENLKTPTYPVWVIGSSSHYTLLFSLNPNVGKKSAREKKIEEIKKVWNIMDPEEMGILPMAAVPQLLQNLQIHGFDSETISQLADPEQLGQLLWMNFLNALSFGIVAELAQEYNTNVAPKDFELYHFNGIVRQNEPAKLSRLKVWSDGAMPQQGFGAQNLSEVIKTKWPHALVEVQGGGNPAID